MSTSDSGNIVASRDAPQKLDLSLTLQQTGNLQVSSSATVVIVGVRIEQSNMRPIHSVTAASTTLTVVTAASHPETTPAPALQHHYRELRARQAASSGADNATANGVDSFWLPSTANGTTECRFSPHPFRLGVLS
jgi:hypothetical protein